MSAPFTMLEVRITPLFLGVPGVAEKAGGITVIDEADTVLVTQFSDLQVEHVHNDGRIGNVKLSMHSPLVEDLVELERALWVGYWRPGENLAETILWGQCNVVDDFDEREGKVELVAADPYAGKARSHYIRRGDAALNIDPERGSIPSHAFSMETLLDAARNTPEQQERAMPCLALGEGYMDAFTAPALEDAAPIEFDRGQEVVDLTQQILRGVVGPDIDIVPEWHFPAQRYAVMNIYAPPTDPAAPGATELGRNLDPVDPDDPQPGEVIFERGIGLDNCSSAKREPGKPITHAHQLDESRRYRVTSVDVASSQKIGAWVGFGVAGFTINRPTRTTPANLTALREIAETIIKAYGKPPGHISVRLRPPDAPGMFHYGHPDWVSSSGHPPGVERIGGDWYMGDYVRVRAVEGYRSFSELARIVKAIIGQDGPNDLPRIDIELVPAIGGTPGEDTDHPDAEAAPTVTITAPTEGATVDDTMTITAIATDDVSIASVELLVDGVTVSPGGFLVSEPYSVSWDTTTLPDGSHTITAIATDTGGNTASASISVTIANAVEPPPPGGPPPEGTNLLYTDGRVIRKVSDAAAVSLRMLNVHTGGFSWSQATFDDIAAQGFNGVRLLVNWKRIETSAGTFDAAELAHVQTSIDRCTTAGLYVILCLGVNSPNWSDRASYVPAHAYDSDGPSTPEPGWDRPTLFSCMVSNGEAYFRRMLQEFGADPNVVAIDPWNEPDEATAALVQAGLQIMIAWGRDEANGAGKCWLVTNRYSSQSAANAFNDWSALDWSHGDLWLQPHSYYAPSSPTDTGWSTSNGMRKSSDSTFWNGSPEATTYNTANKAAMRNHLAPWKQVGQERNAPVVLGELGVQHDKTTATQRDNWMRDMVEAAQLEELAGVAGWIYGNDSDDWSLKRTGVWRPEAARLAAFTTVLT